MKQPEILAPAGSLEAAYAAINGGADAVYFGSHAFNARRSAVGMDEKEMAEAVNTCHKAGVKVYITLNILMKDSEIEAVLPLLNYLEVLNVDGLIVQDFGLIRLLRKYYPDFSLQTSTQGSVYGLSGTLFYEQLGFDRVVLPREMSLQEAAYIKKNCSVELKLFCHGALCYAYSGQCLMSSFIGGRSGNRGLCAQPCRKRYTLEDSLGRVLKTGYLLSMKDLNTAEHLDKIVAAGIDALKIEGRMKSPAYVYGVTRYYREKMDAQVGIDNKITLTNQEVAQLFNRDFTAGRLMGETDVIGDAIGRNRGVFVGTIVKSDGRRALIALEKNIGLSVGDGLSFGDDASQGVRVDALFDRNHKKIEKATHGSCVGFPCRFHLGKGTKVWRNRDSVLMDKLEKAAAQKSEIEKQAIDFYLRIQLGKAVTVETQSQTMQAFFTSEILPQKAQKQSLTKAMVQEQFRKLGDTPFALGEVDAEIEDGVFLSRGELNHLRKGAVAALLKEMETGQPTPKPLPKMEKLPQREPCSRPMISLEVADWQYVDFLPNLSVDEVVLPVFDLSAPDHYFEKVALIRKTGKKVLAKFPRIMNSQACEHLKTLWPKPEYWAVDGVLISNTELLYILEDAPFYKEADASLNCFNGQAAMFLKEVGMNAAVLSSELSGKEMRYLSAHSAVEPTALVYGRQEMMISANCVLNCVHKQCDNCKRHGHYSLLDERGARFPLWLDNVGVTHIYNTDTLMLKNELKSLPHVVKWRISITDENIDEIKDICNYYSALQKGKAVEAPVFPARRMTKGNYKRGVE